MAFTTPKTWSFGEILTSTDMNLYVRDNTEFLFDALPEGLGPNVVQTTKTDTFSTTSATYVTVTDLEATITPSSATSKILLIAQLTVGGMSATRFAGGNSAAYIADTAGSRGLSVSTHLVSDFLPAGIFMVYLDSPATTSATTYSVEMRRGNVGTTGFLNRAVEDGDSGIRFRGASSLTVIEVAA